MTSIFKIFTLFIFVNVSSCVKEDSPKPGGTNTMIALVDGKHFEKKACWGCLKGGSAIDVFLNDTVFSVTAEDMDQKLTIELGIKSLNAPGLYTLSSRDKNFAIVRNYNSPYASFSTSSTNTGRINITMLDLSKHIIAGTFEFSAIDEKNSAHTVNVTAGNFDVTYK
ncbi:MAG: hypothetical protein H7096_13960 [Flavobacterium sp.]|nr:hypothetical protein [Pedobacter sp.]